jgi:serine/threonine protein phosphatase PrpC
MPFMTELISRAGGRPENQDFCAYVEVDGTGCWVVADGLGGYRGGEIASRSAVEAILASFSHEPSLNEQALQGHLRAAQSAVAQAQAGQPDLSTMRTTVVVLLADATRALWAHMGDSRLYCFENGVIAFQTSDHSVVQAMADAGQIPRDRIRHHEDRNRLLRCLGNPASEFRPTVLPEPRALAPDSAFLLCSDGFWDNVLESEMVVDLAKAKGPAEWLTLMEDRQLERANEGDDNYTAVAIMLGQKSTLR